MEGQELSCLSSLVSSLLREVNVHPSAESFFCIPLAFAMPKEHNLHYLGWSYRGRWERRSYYVWGVRLVGAKGHCSSCGTMHPLLQDTMKVSPQSTMLKGLSHDDQVGQRRKEQRINVILWWQKSKNIIVVMLFLMDNRTLRHHLSVTRCGTSATHDQGRRLTERKSRNSEDWNKN